MGYLNVLLSAPEGQVQAIKADSRRLLRPTLLVTVGHVWILPSEAEPLLDLLSEVMDGGRALSPAFRHPLRDPIYHDHRRVRSLGEEIGRAWQEPYAAGLRGDGSGMIRVEFEKILGLFRHASGQGECIVSALLPPTDVGGYDWVRMPFEIVPGGDLVGSGAAEVPRRRPTVPWPAVRIIGSLAGLGAVGVLTLCYWRYGRLARAARRAAQRVDEPGSG